jgi:hypothetical protein
VRKNEENDSMPDIPGMVQRGEDTTRPDTVIELENIVHGTKRDEADWDLRISSLNLVELGLGWKVITKDQAELFKTNWFPPHGQGGFWPDLQPIEPDIRLGLVKMFGEVIKYNIRCTCELKLVDYRSVHVKVELYPKPPKPPTQVKITFVVPRETEAPS